MRLIHAEAVAIDSAAKRVVLSGGRPPVPYDVLSINIGSAPALNDAGRAPGGDSGASPSITPVKPIDGFARRWDLMLERAYTLAASHGGSEPAMRLVVVGGGAGGVELALSMHARLIKEFKARGRSPGLVKVSLVARGKMLMPAHNRQVAFGIQGLGLKVLIFRVGVEFGVDGWGLGALRAWMLKLLMPGAQLSGGGNL